MMNRVKYTIGSKKVGKITSLAKTATTSDAKMIFKVLTKGTKALNLL